MRIRTYSEFITLRTFEERFVYLSLRSSIGIATFGFDRYINQDFYNSRTWRSLRDKIIIRDFACDLGLPGYEIFDSVRIHHMNPMTIEAVERGDPDILDPEFLICTSINTHNMIHFGSSKNTIRLPGERRKGDTKLW
jgi:hypothetical protein